ASTSDVIDFHKVPHLGLQTGQKNFVNYAACWLQVDSDLDLQVRMGSDDGSYLWVGGNLIGKNHVHKKLAAEAYVHPVTLSKGKHLILVKVEKWTGSTSFMLRVADPKGDRPAGVRVWN